MSELKETPLRNFHEQHGARMVPFSGWLMPVQYQGILAEHLAVRNAGGLFDVSHMGEIVVQGPDAEAFLQFLLTNDLRQLTGSKALYSIMCYEDGGCVDDVIVYRRGDSFFICVNAGNTDKDFEWMKEHARGFDVQVLNHSSKYGQLALQGPESAAILQAAGCEPDALQMKRFRSLETEVAGIPVLLSTTGYTGENGYELYCAADQTESLAKAVLDAGTPLGLQLCGLGARDSLRLEAGYPLYGHEIGPDITPLQAGLGWVVKLGKPEDFIGKEVLQSEQDSGPTRKLVHFVLDGKRIARAGTDILWNDQVVGSVVSGAFSPILQRPIGSALVDARAADDELEVNLRSGAERINVKKAPLHG